jgi:hypothetical protein
MSDLSTITGTTTQPVAREGIGKARGPVGGDVSPDDLAKAMKGLDGPAGLGGILSSMTKALGASDAEARGEVPSKQDPTDATGDAAARMAKARAAKAAKAELEGRAASDNQGENVDENPEDADALGDGDYFDFEEPDGSTVRLSRAEALEELAKTREYRKQAAQRFQESDKLHKEADAKLGKFVKGVSSFRDNPDSLFDYVGKDSKEYAWEKVKSDPDFIERAAEEFKRRVESERAEAALTPEDKRVRDAETRLAEANARIQSYEDAQIEQQMFQTTKAAVVHAGLIPDEMVAINALEIQRAGNAKGMNEKNGFGPREVGLILKNHYLKQAEHLMKGGAPGRGPTIQETIAQSGLAPRDRARARSTPAPAPKPRPAEKESVSSLTAMRRMYATDRSSPYWVE